MYFVLFIPDLLPPYFDFVLPIIYQNVCLPLFYGFRFLIATLAACSIASCAPSNTGES
jgi:hypothetical protein